MPYVMIHIDASALLTFSSLTASQHQLHHLSVAFHCNGLGFMPAISLLMIVPHSVIGIAIALSVALLGPQKTPSCLDGSSSSTHSNKHQPLWIFSLSTWMILESCNCCLCFFLPHFTMPHPACTAAIAKKSLQQYLLLLHFLAPKHNEVASLEEVFLHKQGSKGFRLISVLFYQSHIYLIQQSAIGFDQPLSPRFVEVTAEQVEKNTQSTNLYIFMNCDML